MRRLFWGTAVAMLVGGLMLLRSLFPSSREICGPVIAIIVGGSVVAFVTDRLQRQAARFQQEQQARASLRDTRRSFAMELSRLYGKMMRAADIYYSWYLDEAIGNIALEVATADQSVCVTDLPDRVEYDSRMRYDSEVDVKAAHGECLRLLPIVYDLLGEDRPGKKDLQRLRVPEHGQLPSFPPKQKYDEEMQDVLNEWKESELHRLLQEFREVNAPMIVKAIDSLVQKIRSGDD